MGVTCITNQPASITYNGIEMKYGKKFDKYPDEDIRNEKKEKEEKKWRFLCCDQNDFYSDGSECCVSEVGITGDFENEEENLQPNIKTTNITKPCVNEHIETSSHIHSPFESKPSQSYEVHKYKNIYDASITPKNFLKPTSHSRPRQKIHDFYSEDLDIRKTFVTEREICENFKLKRYEGTLSVISEIDSMGSGFERSSQNHWGQARRVNKPGSMEWPSEEIK